MIDINWYDLIKLEVPKHLTNPEDIKKCKKIIHFLRFEVSDEVKQTFNQEIEEKMKKIIIGNTVDVDSPTPLFGIIQASEEDIQRKQEELKSMYSSLKESIVDDLPESPKIWEQKNKREMKRKGWK